MQASPLLLGGGNQSEPPSGTDAPPPIHEELHPAGCLRGQRAASHEPRPPGRPLHLLPHHTHQDRPPMVRTQEGCLRSNLYKSSWNCFNSESCLSTKFSHCLWNWMERVTHNRDESYVESFQHLLLFLIFFRLIGFSPMQTADVVCVQQQ